MEKTIKIDGRDVTFKATGGVMLRYKNQFGREYIADIMELEEFQNTKTLKKVKQSDGSIKVIESYEYTKLNLETFYNLAWTLAKTADSTIPDPLTWLDSFNTFPVFEILPQLMEIIFGQNVTEPKN